MVNRNKATKNNKQIYIANSIKELHDKLPNDKYKPKSFRTIKNVMSKNLKTKHYYFNRIENDKEDELLKYFNKVDDTESIQSKETKKTITQLL